MIIINFKFDVVHHFESFVGVVDSYPNRPDYGPSLRFNIFNPRTQLLPYKITVHKWLKHQHDLRVNPDEEPVLNAVADVLVVKAVKVSQSLRMWRLVILHLRKTGRTRTLQVLSQLQIYHLRKLRIQRIPIKSKIYA
jgi:hypothetical protein